MTALVTGPQPLELLLYVAGVVSAVAVLAGAAWWLVWPRIEDKLQALVRGVAEVGAQLEDEPDTLGRHARVAAGAAAELPAIREQLQHVVDRQALVDEWRTATDRRLQSVEGALLALLGPELRRRLFDDLTATTPTHDT